MSGFQNVVIRASAGTGKTFQLTNRYLRLLHAGVPPEEILATTFTRKAAAEIADRVMVRLAAAALDPEAAAQLADELQIANLTTDRCRELLVDLTGNLHRLRIGTLDSFFAQIARSFSLDMQLPPGWRIIEDVENNAYRDEAIQTLLNAGSSSDIERLVQLMTKGSADRSISGLIRQTVQNLHELYLATGSDAWHGFPSYPKLVFRELAELVDQLRAFPFSDAPRMQKPRDKDLNSVEMADWEGFLSGGLTAKVLDGTKQYYRQEIPAAAVALYQRLIGHARGILVEQLRHQTQASYKLLQRFEGFYQQLKYQARVLSFADVTRAVAAAMLDHADRMEFRLDNRITHLLLDEFQDTSLPQWQVLRPLARRIASGRTNETVDTTEQTSASLLCVGDLKQAIYGWRGGVPEIFDAVEEELPDLTGASLNCSYRSSLPVIDTINQVFSQLTVHPDLEQERPAVTRWQDHFQLHTTAKTQLPGYVELATAPLKQKNQSQLSATLNATADRIAELTRLAPAATIGVLARKNNTVAQLIFELRRRHIHTSQEGGNPLTDSAAVQLILSLLQLADHPADTVARAHLAGSPLGQPLGLTRHDDHAAAVSLAAKIRHQIQAEGYGPVIHQRGEILRPQCNRREASRLHQLVELAWGYQPLAGLRTSHFIQYVRSTAVSDPLAANVRVMTIHKAKGLQFDVVVLPELDAGLVGQPDAFVIHQPKPTEPIDRVCLYRNEQIQALLPDDMQGMFAAATDRKVTESLCVLYVAMTRAIHGLYMIIPPHSSKKLPRTSSGLLQATLHGTGPVGPEKKLYHCGDPCWFEQPEAPRPAEEPARQLPAATQPVGKIELPPPHGDAACADELVSPSSLAGGSLRKISEVLKLETAAAMVRGTVIHAWFEQIGWLEDGLPDQDALYTVAQRHDLGNLDVEGLLNSFWQMLADPQIGDLLHRRHYRPPLSQIWPHLAAPPADGSYRAQVYPERTFAYLDHGQLVYGAIDRLVLLYDGDRLVAGDVIDFKTDQLRAADTEAVARKVQHYGPQLNAYRAAVARTFHLSPQQVAARLAFVSVGLVCSVTP
ncbi:MAG: UvrD-helicase domain-containing protein [Planctomycetales bacterium]|nr:UvrD-helicase domain-containing protein [Planctomycetales bacterium]